MAPNRLHVVYWVVQHNQTRRRPIVHRKTHRYANVPAALLLAVALSSCLLPAAPAQAEDTLPALGDAGSGIVSPEGERRLGAAWLRALRAGTSLYYDPLVADYLEHLAWRLASHSDLAEPRLTLVMLNSNEINAFAVPGGVMGVNAGLLLNAEREDEVASVLAHELAHLSQRHFARGLDQQRQQQPLTLTALLASILVAATVGGDAAAAAMIGTQAGLMQAQLAYSRENEREADRVGMQTLARAGFDPAAMPAFFEKLQRTSPVDRERYPEFLLTHPVADTRISDSRNRARQLPAPAHADRDDIDFRLARIRLQVAFSRDAAAATVAFADALKQAPARERDVLRYGLALAQLRAGRHDEALVTIAPLRRNDPERIVWRVGEADILLAAGKVREAADSMIDGLALAPDNFPLAMTAAQALLRDNRAMRAVALLERQAVLRRNDPNVWQLLARARGATGDTVGVHAARAEYLFLRNQVDPAREQLELGIAAAGEDFARAAPLRNRMRDIEQTRDDFRP
ncbi:MAG: M48 family metalloprotease [Pseudomonadota bacterium]